MDNAGTRRQRKSKRKTKDCGNGPETSSEIPDEVQALIDDKKVSAETYRNLQSIKEEERNNDVTYISLSKENLETLKKELY